MRSCEEYQAWASCLVDGELDAGRTRELRQHAAQCEECRAVLEAFTALSNGMEDVLAEPPETLHQNVMAEIRRENHKPLLVFTARRRQLAAAAGLAVVLLVGITAAYRTRADTAAGGGMMTAVSTDEMAGGAADSQAAAEAEIETYAMPAAVQMAPKAARNAIQADTATSDRRSEAGREQRELTAEQAKSLLSALGEKTDERAEGEPLLLCWTDADGTPHTAALYDTLCTVDEINYALTTEKAALIESLTR